MADGKSSRAVLAGAILAAAGLAVSVAAAAQAQESGGVVADGERGGAEAPSGAAQDRSIRFNFSDIPFKAVVDFFARETGLPVIYETPAPGASFTFVSGRAFPFEEALDILNKNLRLHDAHLQVQDGYLYLRSIKDAARRPLDVVDPGDLDALPDTTYVNVTIPLNRAAAKVVADQMKPLVAEPGRVEAIEVQNMLLVLETAAQARKIRDIVRRIDAIGDVSSEFKLYPLRNAKAEEVVNALKGLVGEKVVQIIIDQNGQQRRVEQQEVAGLTIQPDRRTNSVIAVGPAARLETVSELIALLDLPEGPASEDRQFATFAVEGIDAGDAARQLQGLFRSLPKDRQPDVQALAGVARVMVLGTAQQVSQAAALLSVIDPAAGDGGGADRERLAATLPLEHLTPEQVLRTAQGVLSPRQRAAVSMVPAPGGRGLLVSGPAEDVRALRELVESIDVADGGPREVRVVRVTRGDAAEVLERAQRLDGLTEQSRTQPVQALLDAEAGTITLVGAREALARFEGRLRTAQENARIETARRTYTLSASRPSEMAPSLQRLCRPLLEPADGSAYVAPEFEALDEIGQLVVRARPEQFETIEGLIDQLDRRRASDVQFQVVELSGPEPERLVERALALYAEQTAGLEPAGGGGWAIEHEIDPASGRLLLRGAQAALARFQGLLRQVQQLTPPERTTRLLDVQQADARELVGPLREFLAAADPIDAAREVPEPTIAVVERTNSLLVTAEEAQHRLIADYVRRLDRIEPGDLPPLRLLQLRTADAQAIAQMLSQQYGRRPSAERQAKPVEVRADPATNTLIVSAHEEVFPDIRSLVEQLNEEAGTGPDRKTFIFPLKVAKAVDVAKAMDTLYPQPPMPVDRYNRPMPWAQQPKEVTVSADPSSNSLIIDAPAEREESLRELAEKLDRVEVAPVAELRTYQVVGADLASVANMLRGLAGRGTLSSPAGQGRPAVPVQIETEPKSRTLIVAGDEVTFAKVEEVLASLTAVPVERGLRIVPIANARAAEVRDRALAIYASQVEQIPGAGRVDVTVDEDSNSLEVVADAEAMGRFVRILDELQEQVGPAREVRLIELRLAQVEDVIGFLREMVAASESLNAGGGPRPVFEPIPSTNALMVAAQPAQFAIIEQLVRQLDSRQAAERPPLRILRLRTTDAQGLAEVLNRSYQQRPNEDRVKRPVDVQADAATNTLIVSAHPDVLPEIQAIVEDLNDSRDFEQADRGLVVIPLRHAKAEELARTIDALYPEPEMPRDRLGRPMPQLRQPKEISVRGDRQTNALIVDAPANRLEEFRSLIESLDRASVAEGTELRTYTVRRADLDRTAETIRRLAEGGALNATAQAPVTVNVEHASRTLVVSGPAEVFERVEAVLAEVDGAVQAPATSLRLYPLRHARADRLQPLLQRLLTQRLDEQARGEDAVALPAEKLLDVSADTNSNTLIINAPEGLQETAAQLIESLDTEAAAAGRALVRIVPLAFADAQQVSRTLNEAVQRIDLPAGGPVSVVAAVASNALLITGPARDIDKIEKEMIPGLDQRAFDPEEKGVETFALEHADAGAIRETVRNLLVDQQAESERNLPYWMRRPQQAGEAPQVVVEAEARTNTLVVSGPKASLELARSLVRELDRPSEGADRTVAVFTPARGRAERLAEAARAVLGREATEGRRGVEITPEPGTGALLVAGGAERVARATEVLRDLDERTPRAPAADMRTFALQNVDARGVARTLESMLNDASRWPEDLRRAAEAGVPVPRAAVTADERANRLLVSAPTSLSEMAAEVVAALDAPGAGAHRDVRVFRLERGDAQGVARALQEAFRGDQRPGEPAPTVTAETRSNSVVVSGSAERLARAEGLIAGMDASAEPAESGVRTIVLRHARAEAVAPLVEQIVAEPDPLGADAPAWLRYQAAMDRQRRGQEAGIPVRVAAETRLNAVVVSGPLAALDLAEQVVTGLDVPPGDGPDGTRAVRVITLVNAEAATLAQTISGVFDASGAGVGQEPPPVVRVDAASNSLIARGTREQLETIEDLCRRVDRATVASRREVRTIPIDRSRAEAGQIAEQLRRVLGERPGVEVEIISAEELLNGGGGGASGSGAGRPRSDADGGPLSEVRMMRQFMADIPPHNPALLAKWLATRFAIAAVELQPAADGSRAEGNAAGGREASDEAAAGKVTIAVDPATNSLIVVGSPRVAEQLAELAAELERQLPPEPVRVRILELPEGVEASAVAQLVQQTVRQVGRVSAQNPGGFTGSVVAQPDLTGDRLIVWANETDFASVRGLVAGVARASSAEGLTIKVYPLANIDAQAAARAVTDLLSPSPRGRQAQRLRAAELTVEGPDGAASAQIDPRDVSVTADPSGMSLLVSAPASAVPLIDRFVSLLDQSPASERLAIRRYELENADAPQLARAVQQLLDAQRQGPQARTMPRAAVVADERTNGLLVTASAAQHEQIAALVAEADGATAVDGHRLEVIAMRNALPSEARRVVEEVVVGGDPGRRERIRISAQDDVRLLIVRASEEDLAEIRSVVDRVDGEGVGTFPLRTVKLERADAEEVARLLQGFFEARDRQSRQRGGRRDRGQVSITGDRRSGTLVVAASDEDFRQISELAARFDDPAPGRELRVEVVRFENVAVAGVSATIDELTWQLNSGSRGRASRDDDLAFYTNEQANSVVLFGSGETLATMTELIRQLDQPPTQQTKRVIRAVDAEGLDPDVTAELIQQTTATPGWRWWQGVDPQAVTARVDRQRRVILLVGPETRVAAAAEMVREMAAEARAGGPGVETRTIRLQNAPAARVANNLQQFFRQKARSDGTREDAVTITGSPDGNVLIVTAAPQDQETVARFVEQVDQPELGPDREVRVFRLTDADPAETARTLQQTFPSSARAEDRLIVTPQPTLNSVIVSAPRTMLGQVEGLIRELDSVGSAEELAKVETVQIRNARAEAVAESLRAALPESVKVRITPVPRSNAIILTGSEGAIAVARTQAAALDVEAEVEPLEFRTFELRHVTAADARFTLNQMLRTRPRQEGEPAASIDYSTDQPVLYVAATPDQMRFVEQVLGEVDRPTATTRTTEFIKLQHASADTAATLLGQFFGRFAPEARGPAERGVSIIPDRATDSLVVSADEAVFGGIRSLIERIDREENATGQQLRLIQLRFADAASVARALNEGFRAPLERQLREGQARQQAADRQGGRDERQQPLPEPVVINAEGTPSVSAEPVTNSLVVFASQRDLERIEGVVRQLDTPEVTALPAPRLVPVEGQRPSRLAEIVQRSLLTDAERQGASRRMTVVGDDSAGVLIVRADDEDFERVRTLVEGIRSSGERSMPGVGVIRLANQPAARLQQTVLDTFRPVADRLGETLAVSVDRGTNALVVTAGERLREEIAQVVRELDGAIPAAEGAAASGEQAAAPGLTLGRQVYIFDVEHASPAEVRSLLEQIGLTQDPGSGPSVVGERVSVAEMTTRRALTVVCSPADAPRVESIIRSIDRPSAGEATREDMAVIRLRLADAPALVRTLEEMLNVAEQAVRNGTASSIAEHVRRLNLQRDEIGRPPLELDLTRPIRLVADQQSNAVLVGSTPGNVEVMRELVQTLDTLPVGDAVIVRLIPIEQGRAERIAPIVQDLFERGEALRRLPGTQRRGLPATVTGQALAGEIAVSADARTNSLVVAGREEAVALVERLAEMLDQNETDRGQWAEARLIPLEHADAVELSERIGRVLRADDASSPLQRQVARIRLNLSGGDAAEPGAAVPTDLYAPMSELSLTPEENLNAIIAVGTPANLDAVRELVALLDVEAAAAGNEVQVRPLEHASADRVAQVVGEVFAQRERQRPTRPEDRLVLSVDSRTNALVVSTSPRSMDILDALLARLDAPEARFSVGLHVLPVPDADVADLAPRIDRLMRERLQARRRGGVEGPDDVFSVEPVPSSGVLVVMSSDENLALVREMVAALVGGDARAGYEITEIVQIGGSGRAADVAGTVRELYADRENERRGQRSVSVIPNERLNAIIVSGTERDVEAVRRLVAQLAGAEVSPVLEVRRIDLRSATASEIVRLVEEILAGTSIGGARAGSGQATRLRFLAKDIGDEIEQIEATIDPTIRDQVRLAPDPRTNSVLASAPPAMMRLIERIIRDVDEDRRGDRQIRTIRLTNADARQMRDTLQTLFNLRVQGDSLVLVPTQERDPNVQTPTFIASPDERQELSITIDARTNTLLVSGTEEYLDKVAQVVEALDKIEATERESFVYALRNADAAEVERTLQQYFENESRRVRETLGTQQIGSLARQLEQEVTIVGDEKSNKLVVTVSPRYRDAVMRIIEELDAAPPQVMIQVLLAEVTLDAEEQFGADLRFAGEIDGGSVGQIDYVFRALGGGAGVATALGVPNLSVAATDFELLIRALQVQGKLEVLSRPKVQANNNETARIQVGEDVVVPVGIVTAGDNIFSQVDEKQTGIILSVQPSISSDGFVKMRITPEISSVSARTTQIGQGVEAPIITRREVETTVTVKDGQSVVIGGLIQTQEEDRNTKIPWLGDIPGLGWLFKTREKSVVKTELLVILTPTIIPGDTPSNERMQRAIRDRHLRTLNDARPIVDAVREDTDNDITPPPVPAPREESDLPRPAGFLRSMPRADRAAVYEPAPDPTLPPPRPAALPPEDEEADGPALDD